MSWTEVTWTADEGTQPLADALTAALTAHPAWEFVEETIERLLVEDTNQTPSVWYDRWVMPFQVWKCSSEVSGLESDFFIAYSRVPTTDPDQGPGESGMFPIFGAGEYDSINHWAKQVVGHAYNSTVPFYEDGKFGSSNLGYPWLGARFEDGNAWGNWGSFGNTDDYGPSINTKTMNPQAATNGRAMEFDSWYDGDTNPPTTAYRAFIRITNQGVFLAVNEPGPPFEKYALYLGAYEEAALPEELRVDVPVMKCGPSLYDWGSSSPVQTLALTQYKGIGDADNADQLLSVPNLYNYGYAAGGDTDRECFPFPNIEAYPAMRAGLTAGVAYHLNYLVPGVVWTMPGIWCLSVTGAPGTWVSGEETMTSPDGHECVLFAFGYGCWYAIDTEMI